MRIDMGIQTLIGFYHTLSLISSRAEESACQVCHTDK